MIKLSDEMVEKIIELGSLFDEAEKAIKDMEIDQGQTEIIPAINELRYAGTPNFLTIWRSPGTIVHDGKNLRNSEYSYHVSAIREEHKVYFKFNGFAAMGYKFTRIP